MQTRNGAGEPTIDSFRSPEIASPEPESLEKQVLAIEDWVSQESISTPKDTNVTFIQKFSAALQLLQMVSDKVSCLNWPTFMLSLMESCACQYFDFILYTRQVLQTQAPALGDRNIASHHR